MDMKEYITELLGEYNSKKRHIELLRFELENLSPISDKEIIESLALGSSASFGGGTDSTSFSDKTMMIAMKYRDAGDQLIDQVQTQITQELKSIEVEIDRLDYYLSLLEANRASVIRRFYIDKETIASIAASMNISKGTVVSWRNSAMEELISMYRYWGEVKNFQS